MTNYTDIRDFLRAHCARYPELALQDVFKALYQSAFGCEHLIADPSAAADYIRAEAARSGTSTRLLSAARWSMRANSGSARAKSRRRTRYAGA